MDLIFFCDSSTFDRHSIVSAVPAGEVIALELVLGMVKVALTPQAVFESHLGFLALMVVSFLFIKILTHRLSTFGDGFLRD